MEGFLFWTALVLVYFAPSWTAFWRKHHNQNSIAVLNLFLGWTLLGWVIALVWAVSNPKPADA